MRLMLIACQAALPLLAAAQAQAQSQSHSHSQTVWRCGPDGRSYSDTPCPQGRALKVPDARPAADVEAAQDRVGREKRLADELRQQRLQSEATARHIGAAGIGTRVAAVKPAARPVAKGKRRPKHPEAGDTSPSAAPVFRQMKG